MTALCLGQDPDNQASSHNNQPIAASRSLFKSTEAEVSLKPAFLSRFENFLHNNNHSSPSMQQPISSPHHFRQVHSFLDHCIA